MDNEINALISRAQNGDDSAFEQLINMYEKSIYYIAYGKTKNHEDAKDIAQEAIIKIYRAIKGFKGDCAFSVWIYRITVNTCMDEFRRQKKRSAVSLENMLETNGVQFSDDTPLPDQLLDNKELGETIANAIRSLDDDYRVAVILRDIEGMSYQEIANITGVAMGTVKSRISRARAQLAKKLYAFRKN